MQTLNEGRELERLARNIGPGEWAVEAARPVATLLGSCVAVCLWDASAKIGGMNHFMLPNRLSKQVTADFDVLLCGDFAMEALMNAMLARGARRERLQAKAFGGGAVVATLSETGIGARNVEFAREWLARERITLLASDFLGPWSRKIVLNPHTGDAFCRRNQAVPQQLIQAEERYGRTLAQPRRTSVELF